MQNQQVVQGTDSILLAGDMASDVHEGTSEEIVLNSFSKTKSDMTHSVSEQAKASVPDIVVNTAKLEIRRKPGRPPKKAKMQRTNKKQSPVDLEAFKKNKLCKTVTGMGNIEANPEKHCGELFKPFDIAGPLKYDSFRSEKLVVQSSTNECKQADSTQVQLKRKRGRPRKTLGKVSDEKTLNSVGKHTIVPRSEFENNRVNSQPETQQLLSPAVSQVVLAQRQLRSSATAVNASQEKKVECQQTSVKGKHVCPQATFRTKTGNVLISSDQPESFNISDSPRATEDSTVFNARVSLKQWVPPKNIQFLPNVKTEDIEIDLGDDNSNSLKHLHYYSKVKSEFVTAAADESTEFESDQGNLKKQMEQRKLGTTAAPKKRRRSIFGHRRKENSKQGFTKRKTQVEFKCKDCNYTCKFPSQYIRHLRTHSGEKPINCPDYDIAYKRRSALNVHRKKHLSSSDRPHVNMKKQSQDHGIGEYERQNKNQVSHASLLINDSETAGYGKYNINTFPIPVKGIKHVCQFCRKPFSFRSELSRHLRVHTGEKPYTCKVCGKSFAQLFVLHNHEVIHWSSTSYKCSVCGESFKHHAVAKKHSCSSVRATQGVQSERQTKPLISYTCQICKKTFFQKRGFHVHMKTHTGEKPFRCLYCDQQFENLLEMNAHQQHCEIFRRRKEESDFQVNTRKASETFSLNNQIGNSSLRPSAFRGSFPKCIEPKKIESLEFTENPYRQTMTTSNKLFQSSFISSNHLSHLVSKLNKLDSRSDPRKYLCPNCGRLFRHMGRLRAHMLTHSRNQSYSCGCCGKTLENWKKLWQHQRVHRQRQGRFTCPVCGQGFRFVGPYKGHMKKHPDYTWIQERPSKVSYGQQTSSLPYECEECSSRFETLDFLFSHQICHLSIDNTTANCEVNGSVKDFQLEHRKVYCYQSQSTPKNSMCPKQVRSLAPRLPGSDLIKRLSHSKLSKTVKLSSPSLLYRDVPSHENNEGNVFGKQVRADNGKIKQITRDSFGSKKYGLAEGINCAVCGNVYSGITELYKHYLQHARGQL